MRLPCTAQGMIIILDKAWHVMISSIVAVSALFILTRIMGRKQMSQLTLFDYVISISIGSIASDYAIHGSVHIVEGLTALAIFTLFSIAVSYISVKSYRGRKWLDGVPIILIENGRIIEGNLTKTKLSINDLMEECRQKNVFDIADIEFAILETSGKLSVLLKSQSQPLTPRDMHIETAYRGLCAPVVIDGNILVNHLHTLHLDESWLHAALAKQNIKDCANVLFAYVNTGGTLVVHYKNVKLSKENNFTM